MSPRNHWSYFSLTVRDSKTCDSPIFPNPLLLLVQQACTFFPSSLFGTVLCEGKISLHVLQKNYFPNNFLLKSVGSLGWLIAFFSLGFFSIQTLHSFTFFFPSYFLEQFHSVSNLICLLNRPIYATWKKRVWEGKKFNVKWYPRK